MLTKHFETNWIFNASEAILTCNKLKCNNVSYLIYGGHDRVLSLMDNERNILDRIEFDGWCRCSYPIDLDNDGCDEILVGAGDGSILVLKLHRETLKLFAIMHYKAEGKITCCTAGDLNQNGSAELIFGGDHHQLLIFAGINFDRPKHILYFDSWVTSCAVGLLKFQKDSQLTRVLAVGTKNGILQLVKYNDDGLSILWQKNLGVRINDIKIGDVTNDGKNEIIVASDESYLKILNPDGYRLKYIKIKEGRPLCVLIHDIDGDNSNEIILGGADGSLKVFQNELLESINLELKWKTKVNTSIKDIFVIKNSENRFENVVFSGYVREIQSIYDYKYGQKQKLDIKRRSQEEELLTDSVVKSDKKLSPVPVNIKEKIYELFKSRIYFTLDGLKNDLIKFGYSQKKISEIISSLLDNHIISQRRIKEDVWNLDIREKEKDLSQISKKEIKVKVEEPKTEKIPVFVEVEEQPQMISSLKDLLIEFIKSRGIVSSKGEIIEEITKKGFDESRIESEIDNLRELNLIEYSRSKPRGWQIGVDKSLETEEILELKKDAFENEIEIKKSIIELLRKEKTISSKSNLIETISSMGYDKDSVEVQIDKLNDENKISYSRSKPRGWKLVD
jgi:hypothetical protein